ncbi:MAG: hypothetical protein HY835_03360, partial [Anaerolineae bacterium]|nr:hypothetical protein [Anaerolineae bacterium]
MTKRWTGGWLVVLLLLLVTALGIVAAGRLTAQAVQAQTAPPVGLMSTFAPCTVLDVGVFIQRVHVR